MILGHAKQIDQQKKKVILDDGEIDYDYLIIATGMNNNYFAFKSLARRSAGYSPPLLLAFEAAVAIQQGSPGWRGCLFT